MKTLGVRFVFSHVVLPVPRGDLYFAFFIIFVGLAEEQPVWSASLYSLPRIHNKPPEVPFAWDLPDLNIYGEQRRHEESPSPAPQWDAASASQRSNSLLGS